MLKNHIIIIGFTAVGKSLVGKAVAKKMRTDFFDLDREIEKFFDETHGCSLTCREIVANYGEAFFRDIETQSLEKLTKLPPSIIALGGGAVSRDENRAMINLFTIIHLVTSPEIVFERMLSRGLPLTFPLNKDEKVSFDAVWEQRNDIYEELATITVPNDASIDDAVNRVLSQLI